MTEPMNPREFETARKALFSAHGAQMRDVRVSDAQGRETYALLRGEVGPDACPTVLIHGGLADAHVWALMAGKLEGALIIPDRPGCGLSFPVDYTGVDYRRAAADWLRSVCDELGARRIDLVGNSMGGFFSMAFAAAHPERVRNLVLVGAPAGLDRPLPIFIKLLSLPWFGSWLSKMQIRDHEKLRKQVFASLLAHPERVPAEALDVAIANASFPASQRCVHTMARAFATLGGVRPELMMRDEMARLPVRTLFLWGDDDQFAPPESGQALAEKMPDARVEVLEDVGHLPQLDAPDQVAEHTRAFIREGEAP